MRNKADEFRSLTADFLLKFSNQFIFTTLMVYVYQKSNRAIDLGIISTSMIAPSLIFVFFSNRIMVQFSSLSTLKFSLMLRSFLLFWGALFAQATLHFALIAALVGLLQQVIGTAKLSYDGHLIPSGKRLKFNAHRAFLGSLAIIMGPSLGGFVSGYFGGPFALGIMGLITLACIVIPKNIQFNDELKQKNNMKTETNRIGILNTLNHLKTMPNILVIILLYIVVTVILEMEAPLIFPFVKETYNAGGDIAGALLGACGIGGLLGAVYMQRFSSSISAKAISLLIVFDGFILFIFACGLPLLYGFLIFSLLGIIGTLTLVSVESEIQEKVESKYRPILFSAIQFAGGVGGASITLISTGLADVFGAFPILAGAAILEVLIGCSSFTLLLFTFITLSSKYKLEGAEIE